MSNQDDTMPMSILLWRHAEAEDGLPDDCRRLTRRGQRQARRVAGWLNKHLPRDARVVVSPAVRARETARVLDRAVEISPMIAPGATADEVLLAAGWPAAGGTVLVIGHQSALGQAAARLLSGVAAPWAVRKGSLWWIEQRTDGKVGNRLLAVIGPEHV